MDKRKGLIAAIKKWGPTTKFLVGVAFLGVLSTIYFGVRGATKGGQVKTHRKLDEINDKLSTIAKEIFDEENQIYYKISELKKNNNASYYRTILITNKTKISKYGFTLRLTSTEILNHEVNGPRPIGGGSINYYKPKVYENICEAKIDKLKPGLPILIGLTAERPWDFISITALRN